MVRNSFIQVLGFALVCYFAALAPRVWMISERSIQPDEHHWLKRSATFIHHLAEGNYSNATSHLNQPGIVPSLVMGIGQWVAEKCNFKNGLAEREGGYVNRLSASRVSIAVVSSLIAPLIFLAGIRFMGFMPSLLAALLIAFDPHHVDLSRIAHLDAVLSLLVTATFFTFLYAERSSRVTLKCLAGVFWGLCLATKPTSVVLILALLIYKVCLGFGLWKDKAKILSWSDFYAVLIAHVLLCSIYTKFWNTNSSYVWRLKIENDLAIWTYEVGTRLQGLGWLTLVTGAMLCVAVSVALKNMRSSAARHLPNVLFVCCFLLFFWLLFPAVYENQILYWLWAFGLSSYSHQAYGLEWEPPPLGYLGIIFRQVPTLVVIGALIGILEIWNGLKNEIQRNQSRFLFACLMIVALWIAILGVSSKQGIRYLLPALPAMYCLAGMGLVRLTRFLSGLVRAQRLAQASLFTAILALSCFGLLRWAPYYELYYTGISGGLERAFAENERLPAVGQRDALTFLRKKALDNNQHLEVMVLGDAESLKLAYKAKFPQEKIPFNLRAFGALGNGDYVLVFPNFRRVHQEWQSEHRDVQLRLVHAYRFKEIPLTSVFSIPYLDYTKPETIPIRRSPKRTGTHEEFNEDGPWVAIGRVGSDRKEVLFHGQYARVKAGKYRFSVPLGVPPGTSDDELEKPKDTAVVKLEMSSACYRIVRLQDLELGELSQIDLECEFNRPLRAHLKVYWWAKVSVAVGSPTLVNVSKE